MANILNAEKIQGWMRPEELEWLGTQASTRKIVVEVGSWMGRSTRAIADNLPEDGVVYAVDTWEGTPGPNECAALLKDRPKDWLMQQFIAGFPEEYFKGPRYRVRPLRDTSLRGAVYLGRRAYPHGCYDIAFDMIFLDAAHDYDNVLADIRAWHPLLAEGGLMCGHDFGGSFAGVQRAVQEVFPKAHKVGAGSIWVAE